MKGEGDRKKKQDTRQISRKFHRAYYTWSNNVTIHGFFNNRFLRIGISNWILWIVLILYITEILNKYIVVRNYNLLNHINNM